jgi:ATP-dependent RNA helicase SUPV3L1/SUV3
VLVRGTPGATLDSGFRQIATQAVRVDLIERIARSAHDARAGARAGRGPFAPDPALAISIGVAPATLERLMAGLGFRAAPPENGRPRWIWRGQARAKITPPPRDNAFSALADLALFRG